MPTQVTSVANFHHLESLLLLIFLQRVDILGKLGRGFVPGKGQGVQYAVLLRARSAPLLVSETTLRDCDYCFGFLAF